jgi:hypothetical protein
MVRPDGWGCSGFQTVEADILNLAGPGVACGGAHLTVS